MSEYIEREECKKCFHFQVCANVLKQQLFIREKMLKEENPKCEHFIHTADVVRCGKWLKGGLKLLVCSNCGFEYDHAGFESDGLNYCPNCGARMHENERKVEEG